MFHDYAPVFIIGMLNSFAEKTENGIIDFDTYVTDPEKYDGFLIYDKSNGKVVCDMYRGREWPLVRFQFRLDPWPETIF